MTYLITPKVLECNNHRGAFNHTRGSSIECPCCRRECAQCQRKEMGMKVEWGVEETQEGAEGALEGVVNCTLRKAEGTDLGMKVAVVAHILHLSSE